jgi:alkanesulfonate monooxygenase SsuD/methylene tetrahydromethanopterin reductase-like flavin-dependent oxidoreductase (luciferase family)
MSSLKVAVGIGGAASGAERDWPEVVRFAAASERLGVDFCWSAEAWGQDCVAPLAYLAARTERMRLGTGIMQISARVPSAFTEPIRRGAQQAGRDLADLDLQAGGPVKFGTDIGPLLREVKRSLAFRLGAMGSRRHNFYNLACQRAGFEAEALAVQELWLAGRRGEAAEAVPDDMARLSAFVGTDDMVRDRLRAFRAAGITTVRAEPDGATTDEKLATLARFMDLVRELGPG